MVERAFKGAVFAMGLVWLALEPVAVAQAPAPAIDADALQSLLERYRVAWERNDPFALAALSRQRDNPFQSLLAYERFDAVAESEVLLTDLEVAPADTAGQWTVAFTRTQEDLFRTGLVSRGIARVQMRLASANRGLVVLEHAVAGRPGGEVADGYGSSAPDTWSEEHSAFDRALFAAFRLMLAGAHEDAAKALSELTTAPSGLPTPALFDPSLHVAKAHYLLALCHQRTGDVGQVDASLDQALTLHPRFSLALNARAARRLSRGELDGAILDWQRSLEVHPRQPEAKAQLEFLSAAVTQYPDPALRAEALSVRGQPSPEAVSTLKSLLRKDKTNVETRRRLASVYLLAHDAKSAEKVLLENELLHPTDIETQYLLGRTLLAMDRIDDALKLFAKVWASQPGYRDTLVYLAELNAYLRRNRLAMSYLSEGLELAGDSPEVLYKLGLLSLKVGRNFEGLSYLRRAKENRPPAAIRRHIWELLGAES
jgi:tetratricopeptide (TPR) repeat protein